MASRKHSMAAVSRRLARADAVSKRIALSVFQVFFNVHVSRRAPLAFVYPMFSVASPVFCVRYKQNLLLNSHTCVFPLSTVESAGVHVHGVFVLWF